MEQALFTAKLAERAGRFDEMLSCMKRAMGAASSGEEPSQEVRNLVSVAYKGALSQRRFAYRILAQAAEKEAARGMNHGAELIKEYQQEIAAEIVAVADEAVEMAGKLISQCKDLQARVHLMLLRADCYRYIAEIPGPRQGAATQGAIQVYNEALGAGLPPDHHTALSVGLNRAIFVNEVQGDKQKAMQLLEELLSSDSVKQRRDNNVIVNLITNNLKLWQMGKQ